MAHLQMIYLLTAIFHSCWPPSQSLRQWHSQTPPLVCAHVPMPWGSGVHHAWLEALWKHVEANCVLLQTVEKDTEGSMTGTRSD